MAILWDGVPEDFHYLKDVVEACGETRVENYDDTEGGHISFIDRATPDQLALLRAAKNEIERREDAHLINRWCTKAESRRPSEKTAAWHIRGILFLVSEL
jgi:hypothetical protein